MRCGFQINFYDLKELAHFLLIFEDTIFLMLFSRCFSNIQL